MSALTHFDEFGSSRLVDVGAKTMTARMARAESFVTMRQETLTLIVDRQVAKGDVFEIARLAGIMATKRTADLIPLCHPLGIDAVEVHLHVIGQTTVRIESVVRSHGRTGIEMESLMAVSVAALTIYDMCKAVDREMTIGPTRLLEKSGGRSGHFQALTQTLSHPSTENGSEC